MTHGGGQYATCPKNLISLEDTPYINCVFHCVPKTLRGSGGFDAPCYGVLITFLEKNTRIENSGSLTDCCYSPRCLRSRFVPMR